MKTLILTDFSRLSKVAIQYIMDFSRDINMQLVILHFVDTDTPTRARLSSGKLEEAIKKSSEQEMNQLIKTIKDENSHKADISSKIIFGSSIEKEVEKFALKNNIDIICIGTKGATGLKKILLGSNAASIIDNSSIPVLTIPEYAKYKVIKNIVYSSDLQNIDKELEFVLPFAKLLNAWVHILHIKKDNEEIDKDLKSQVEQLKASLSYKKVKLKTLKSISVLEGINKYIEDIDADMLTMFTHHTNLIEKLFLKSVAQKAAFQTRIPLLTFQKE